MPLKLIGAGWGRTATLSLKAALEQIGFGRCYHMTEVFLAPEAPALWIRAAEGTPDWEKISAGFAATVDFPACRFWKELSDFYPHAKVLLSVRDPDVWFESTQATIFSERGIAMLKGTPMQEFFDKTLWNVFGDRIHDRNFMVDAFKRHNEEVQRTIPKERLLVYEASQGWDPLCAFLNVPVPNTPFPRVNSREEMTDMLAAHSGDNPEAAMDIDRLRETLKARFRRDT